jgi:hypothetical protein
VNCTTFAQVAPTESERRLDIGEDLDALRLEITSADDVAGIVGGDLARDEDNPTLTAWRAGAAFRPGRRQRR